MSAWLRLALREFRGSGTRWAFFTACLSVGVAAVVAVAGLSTALDDGIQAQARQLLAADISIQSRQPIPPEALEVIHGLPEAQHLAVTELASVVFVPGSDSTAAASTLCELKAVGGDYPYYGDLQLDPDQGTATLLAGDHVVVAPELLDRLGVRVGDRLRIGEATLLISGTVVREPDRMGVALNLGPRVLLSQESLAKTQLTGLGSRVVRKVLIKLPDGTSIDGVRRVADQIGAALPQPTTARVETYVEAQPALRDGLQRVERFLGLVALLSLLIGGIGVAQSIRAWLSSRLDSIAIIRAVGGRPREVFLLYLGQTAALALTGSLAGAVLGSLVAQAVPRVLSELLPVQVAIGWQPATMAWGMTLGVGVALLFALGPLTEVLRVSPARVFRRDAEPLAIPRALTWALGLMLIGGITLIAAAQSASLTRGLQFSGGLLLATAVLTAGAWLVVRGVGSAPRNFGPQGFALRHGFAALARPGAGTLGAVVALGLGVMVVLGMFLIQERLASQLDADLPLEAPSVFLVDIQPSQWDGVREILNDQDAQRLDSVEVVVGRMRAIDDVSVAELIAARGEDAGRRNWVMTREQRLTSMTALPPGNEVIEGALWSNAGLDELSVEQEFAEDMGVRVGSRVRFDIQGVPLELTVTSLRTVEWERFSLNFFLVVEPGVLDQAPAFRVATAQLAEEAEQPTQNALAARYPNITMLRIREVLDKVIAILTQVGFGVRLLGGFSVLAGIAILIGSISAGAARRGQEVALYKALGMTRRQVVTAFAVEYALIGGVAGAIGTGGGVALAWAVSRFGFQLPWAFLPGTYVLAIGGTIALTVGAGLAASVRALWVRPLTVLRDL